MKKVTINLRGWADSIMSYGKIEFAIQLAMYNILHDCDWKFKIETEGSSDVREQHLISVVASRYCSVGYTKQLPNHYSLGVTEYKFSFHVPSYTLENVYIYGCKEIKKIIKKNNK